MLARLLALGAAALLAAGGCASSGRPPAPRPSAPQVDRLVAAERLYRAGDPEFAALRDRLAADPAAAFWLTRMLVDDLIRTLEARKDPDDVFLETVAEPGSPLESRALEQLRALGAAAVPALVADLIRSRYSDRRELGAEILAQIGSVTAPALAPLLQDDDWHVREAAAQAVAGMDAGPAVDGLLAKAAGDPHFAVRAAAVAGYARRGDHERLRAMLADDDDAYVRRQAAAALAGDPSRPTAAALVDFYADGVARDDRRAVEAADASLRAISGQERPQSLEFWRAWLAGWRPEGGR